MNVKTFPSESQKPGLKESKGWFAAGHSFREALTLLSDGAFKLFAYICLEADRTTGSFVATHKELAAGLRKSKRIIGSYAAELERARICRIRPARNQYGRTTFEVCDEFWPYRRNETDAEPIELRNYIDSIRECYVVLDCTRGSFGAADRTVAKDLYQRRILLDVVRDAMLLGACRKYSSWLNGMASEPIQSLRYFEPVIQEILQQPLAAGYSDYLRAKSKQLGEDWTKLRKQPSSGGYSHMVSPEIVQ